MSIKDRGSKRGSIRKKKTSEMLILRGLSYHLFSLSGADGSKPKIFKYNQLLSHFHK